MPTDHPILFSGPMVQAILAGRKTQTRRVINPQPPHWTWNNHSFDDRCINVAMVDDRDGYYVISRYGKPGDRLWVRETFRELIDLGAPLGSSGNYYEYKADGLPNYNPAVKWKPSIHMPRKASRITLETVSVRVERVQEISKEDVISEGIPQYTMARGVLSDPAV